MKNRAKCKLCSSIIESFYPTDFVSCKCGEISVDGGDSMRCLAKDFKNFLRVDENGNEIEITVISSEDLSPKIEHSKLTKKDLIFNLDEMIKNIEKLPSHVMTGPISHYDFASLLMLLSSLFKIDCNSDS